MFDMLTRDQLYALHTSLWETHTALHAKIIDPATLQAAIDPLCDLWNVISAACAEISETMHAVHAEITRRETVHA